MNKGKYTKTNKSNHKEIKHKVNGALQILWNKRQHRGDEEFQRLLYMGDVQSTEKKKSENETNGREIQENITI